MSPVSRPPEEQGTGSGPSTEPCGAPHGTLRPSSSSSSSGSGPGVFESS